jgi:hypothetical protein
VESWLKMLQGMTKAKNKKLEIIVEDFEDQGSNLI